MKKFILFLSVCTLVLSLSNCKNNSNKSTADSKTVAVDNMATVINIPDANFKAYLVENFDQNKDGEISLSEALAVEHINCSGKDIASVDGLEHFTNIVSIDCSNNKMIDLDVRYNKKINKLDCKENDKPFTLYVGFSTPIMSPNARKPSPGSPEDLSVALDGIDKSKCSHDNGIMIQISYDY